ncbi:anthranilate synthase component I [Asticcacaulis excentricus]|uniref:Anthranilate synthase component 1 n=1 Tax=Asticcacaulis excentricus (strain ATCC 15261 / DSM 4724 / KCTC 12464 / NCIMB 9791 / VKM B-1370 / CB 48) TaxID=573065 RepID=E8RSR5_ASTEC|nr:anthranilate synthase component I [Asticcacaulis excentricus]ADU14536.1 anthranilate synthase component I [Asticcacaulis excentricus CB 48]
MISAAFASDATGVSGFAAKYDAGQPVIVTRRLTDDLETPVSAYLKLAKSRAFSFLFESVEGGALAGRYSILTLRPDLVWRCFGERAEIARGEAAIAKGLYEAESAPTLESLRALVTAHRLEIPADLPPMISGLFGVFGYDLIRRYEPLGPANPDPLSLPDAVVCRPSVICVFDNVKHEILLATTVWPGAGVNAQTAYSSALSRLDQVEEDLRLPLPPKPVAMEREQPALTSPTSAADYSAMVEKAKEYIAAGDIFQVVPSHRFEAPFDLDPFAFYRSLRRQNPSPYLFYLDFGNFQLAGSSPEILVRVRDGKLTIRPIAGTRPRGKTPEEDKALEAELLADPKELSEHLMLLDLGRNDVGRVAKPASVRVTQKFYIERYSHVMHIVSNVEGDAPENLDPVDALLAALPAGTLSGAPKVRAMEIIDELESVKRGVGYAGGVGYISGSGSLDVCIVLRTALFKDEKIYVQAGAGVVADSVPLTEYQETVHKASALIKAASEAWRYKQGN